MAELSSSNGMSPAMAATPSAFPAMSQGSAATFSFDRPAASESQTSAFNFTPQTFDTPRPFTTNAGHTPFAAAVGTTPNPRKELFRHSNASEREDEPAEGSASDVDEYGSGVESDPASHDGMSRSSAGSEGEEEDEGVDEEAEETDECPESSTQQQNQATAYRYTESTAMDFSSANATTSTPRRSHDLSAAREESFVSPDNSVPSAASKTSPSTRKETENDGVAAALQSELNKVRKRRRVMKLIKRKSRFGGTYPTQHSHSVVVSPGNVPKIAESFGHWLHQLCEETDAALQSSEAEIQPLITAHEESQHGIQRLQKNIARYRRALDSFSDSGPASLDSRDYR